MDIALRILVVEESGTDSMVALKALHSNGYHQMYRRVETSEDLIIALNTGTWDIVIVDISIQQFDEQSVLRIIKESSIDLPCLILSEKVGEERQVRTIKDGVHDYINQEKLNQFIPSVRSEVHGCFIA